MVVILLIAIAIFIGFKLGWHKRNLQSNNYIFQQKEYYQGLYESEKGKNRESSYIISQLRKQVEDAQDNNNKLYKWGYQEGYADAKCKHNHYLHVVPL